MSEEIAKDFFGRRLQRSLSTESADSGFFDWDGNSSSPPRFEQSFPSKDENLSRILEEETDSYDSGVFSPVQSPKKVEGQQGSISSNVAAANDQAKTKGLIAPDHLTVKRLLRPGVKAEDLSPEEVDEVNRFIKHYDMGLALIYLGLIGQGQEGKVGEEPRGMKQVVEQMLFGIRDEFY